MKKYTVVIENKEGLKKTIIIANSKDELPNNVIAVLSTTTVRNIPADILDKALEMLNIELWAFYQTLEKAEDELRAEAGEEQADPAE